MQDIFFRHRPDVINAFLPYCNWVFGDNSLTTQLLPHYDELYGPGDGLNNLRMKEFHFTELYYKNYMEEKLEEDLNLLITIMYRPMQKGERIVFNANQSATYAKRINEWPLTMRLAILLRWLPAAYHRII